MASREEKRRRAALVHDIVQQKRREVTAAMPLSRDNLGELFDYLDQALQLGCDHSLRFTCQFLADRALPDEPIIQWLGQYGGFCDCEVLGNVEDAWPRGE